MKTKLWFAAALLAAGVALAGLPAAAASGTSFGVLKDVGATQSSSSITKAHLWHRTCQRGLNGWHKHVKGVGRVECTNHICRHGKCRWF